MNMNGWDTIFVASMDYINQALANSTSTIPQTFSFSEQGYSTSGTFGTWSVVPGGSSQLLMLQIALPTGTMTMTPGAPPISIAGMSVQLLVSLQLLPVAASPGGSTLVFDFKQVGPASSTAAGVVTPHGFVNPGALTLVQQAALANAIANVLVQHAADVAFVFASISPERAASVNWMRPVSSAYCYLAPQGATAVLAILSVTSNRDISALPRLVDPGILQGVGNAGLAVSSALFLQNVMAPALLSSLRASGSLVLNSAGVLQNSGTLSLPEVDKAGESYHPQIDSMTVTLVDTQMLVTINGSCDMHMGVSMTFSATSTLGVSLAADGTSLVLSTIGTPTFHKDVDIPWYDHLFDVFGGLAEAILQICVAAISSELGGGISDLTSATALVQGAPSVVAWAGSGGFKVQSASLASSLLMRGGLA